MKNASKVIMNIVNVTIIITIATTICLAAISAVPIRDGSREQDHEWKQEYGLGVIKRNGMRA